MGKEEYANLYAEFGEYDYESECEKDDPEFVSTIDAAIAMVEAGETFWSHPGWVRDLVPELEKLVLACNIKARLWCGFLACTIPADFADEEVARFIRLVARGKFAEAMVEWYEGDPVCCDLESVDVEHLYCTLNWQSVAVARERIEQSEGMVWRDREPCRKREDARPQVVKDLERILLD